MPRDIIKDKFSTWLVIPYFDGDTGTPGVDRPLSNITGRPIPESYLCESIRVNGGPLRKYVPNEPTTVEVTVVNLGGGTSIALTTVTVWWAVPGPAFAHPQIFGQTLVKVKSRGLEAGKATIVGKIPGDAPRHVCLLVAVTAPGDSVASNVGIAPGSDRHWAQLNLDSVVPEGNGQFATTFLVSNTGSVRRSFAVTAREPSRRSLDELGKSVGLKVTDDAPLSWRMIGPDGQSASGNSGLRVLLDPGQSEEIKIEGRISSPLEPGTGRIIEVSQHSMAGPDFGLQGALGIVLTT